MSALDDRIKKLRGERTEPTASAAKKQHKVRGRPFQPGQSGNPKGRTKGSKNWMTLWKEMVIEIAKKNGMKEDAVEKVLMLKAFDEAKGGHFGFYDDIMNRRFGKVPIAVGGTDGDKEILIRVDF